MAIPDEASELLTFWFGTAAVRGPVSPAGMSRWFSVDPAFDATLRERFGALAETAAGGGLDAWSATAEGALARVLLLDQLPRNLHRDDARAFACDALAREVASAAIDAGHDRAVSALPRSFFYLPFEHAEDLAAQDRSVALFLALAEASEGAPPELLRSFVDYAEKHRAVIARFGRFPHRNAALGRESTAGELAFLEGGRGF